MTQLSFCGRLTELAVLRFAGEDAQSFLQGQLTNDVTRVTDTSLLTAGWCSPRGRLLAVFQLAKDGDDILALVPADQKDALTKRLRMYILRSRVRVTEDSTILPIGIVGDVAAAELPDSARVFSLTCGTPESLTALGLPAGRAIALVSDADHIAAAGDESLFWAATAAAGAVIIRDAVKDQFVPQGVNLELTGGVSFTKGCYTGQEIVSRVEHIGKTPRRGTLMKTDAVIAAGAELTNDAGEVAGTVVYSAAATKGVAVFVQCTNEMLGKPLTYKGQALAALSLPYTYERQH